MKQHTHNIHIFRNKLKTTIISKKCRVAHHAFYIPNDLKKCIYPVLDNKFYYHDCLNFPVYCQYSFCGVIGAEFDFFDSNIEIKLRAEAFNGETLPVLGGDDDFNGVFMLVAVALLKFRVSADDFPP
mmetsp:Transcript_27608/g.34163  ORF Transcript_27608/g.34163 Transcript_27608/m.34163 type:complete len:127 (+) Transcript_27608:98-478(+)